jgi:ribosome-binding factor A
MPEQRGRQYHRERVGEALKDEIGVILEGELADPRIALCNVTELLLAPDGKSARVFLHVLLERLGKRHIPELFFLLDRSQEYGARIDELLGRIKKRKK